MSCYWRFIGEKIWHYGYKTDVGAGLVRMGRWNGDFDGGVVVSVQDVEIRKV